MSNLNNNEYKILKYIYENTNGDNRYNKFIHTQDFNLIAKVPKEHVMDNISKLTHKGYISRSGRNFIALKVQGLIELEVHEGELSEINKAGSQQVITQNELPKNDIPDENKPKDAIEVIIKNPYDFGKKHPIDITFLIISMLGIIISTSAVLFTFTNMTTERNVTSLTILSLMLIVGYQRYIIFKK